jgi:DNA-binding response OmpR family regulator
MPEMNGPEVCRRARALENRRPPYIIMLAGKAEKAEIVAGLDAGADDYIQKPFEMDELAARVRSAIRARSGQADPVLRSAGLALHPDTKKVSKNGTPVSLSAREFALLELLMRRPGVPMSRAQLEDRLLGWGEEVASNALEVNIHNLRRKLGAECILDIRGVGYFVPKDDTPWSR